MTVAVELKPDKILRDLPRSWKKAATRAMRKAGSTALRDMRRTASKRVREQKRLKRSPVSKALVRRGTRSRSLDKLSWTLGVTGKPVSLSEYPHRQTRKGVSVTINRGKRTKIRSAFVAQFRSGKRAIAKRRGAARLPVDALLGSRPVDALLKRGEAQTVARRGRDTIDMRFLPLLRLELKKARR